jgi:hypothetical protein
MKIPAGHYYIPDAPKQHGYLLIEVTKDEQVKIVSPASKWWRDKVFATVEEFREVYMKETIFTDRERLVHQMGQFQNYYGKLFYYSGERLGWRYIKGVR